MSLQRRKVTDASNYKIVDEAQKIRLKIALAFRVAKNCLTLNIPHFTPQNVDVPNHQS